jgi:hypothetical protein
VSVRYPASWSTDSVDQPDNPSYRFFMAPGEKGQKTTPTSASLLAARDTSLDAYAAALMEGATAVSNQDVERQGLKGKAYRYGKPPARFGLVLLPTEGGVLGLYVQGDDSGFTRHRAAVDEMMDSFTVERPAAYVAVRDTAAGFALRLPPSWKRAGGMSNASITTIQFISPPVGVDRDGSRIHAGLVVKAQPFAGDADAFYAQIRREAGHAYKVASHTPWKGGWVDVEMVETAMSEGRLKRFITVSGGRAYSLVFETREDVFHRVSAWCDLIASTFEAGPAKP